MHIPDKTQDAGHWFFTGALAVLSFIVENGNEIIIVCTVLSAILQLYVQLKRANRERKKDQS